MVIRRQYAFATGLMTSAVALAMSGCTSAAEEVVVINPAQPTIQAPSSATAPRAADLHAVLENSEFRSRLTSTRWQTFIIDELATVAREQCTRASEGASAPDIREQIRSHPGGNDAEVEDFFAAAIKSYCPDLYPELIE